MSWLFCVLLAAPTTLVAPTPAPVQSVGAAQPGGEGPRTAPAAHPSAGPVAMPSAGTAAHPSAGPAALPSAKPVPRATAGPVIIPPPGIYRPEWETIDPNAPTPAPAASGPPALPNYVGLGPREKALAERLRDLVALIEGYLEVERLASARVALERAERLVAGAEADFLVLKLHAAWAQPRVRLLDLRAAYEAQRRGPLDAESRKLAAEAAKRVGSQLDELEKGWARLTTKQAAARVEAARRAFAQALTDPLMVDNPAWKTEGARVQARLEKLEHDVAVRVGQSQLLEQVLRLAELKRSADQRLAEGAYDDALGDLAALDEACLGFEHDLAELVKAGYDLNKLVWIGPEGELRGKAFLARVAAWKAEAQRRWDVVETARARAKLREHPLLPPDVPAPPVLPPAAPATPAQKPEQRPR